MNQTCIHATTILLALTFSSAAFADVFNDAVDIVIDDVTAGVPGVAAIFQVPASPVLVELLHAGPGGFDVDLTPIAGSLDFNLRIVHFAPIAGIPIGAFRWNLSDVDLRKPNGAIQQGRITGVVPLGGAIPTVGAPAFTDTSVTINTAGFPSNNLGAVSNYRVQMILLGDINGDFMVNLLDVGPFITAVGMGGVNPAADFDGNGVVNLLDVAGFIAALGC